MGTFQISRYFRLWPFLVPVLAILAVFHRIAGCPDCFLFVNSADGLKNYFTFAWYLKYDTGWWFTGMNYPYGEHIVFTDNQPAWAMLLNALEVFGLPASAFPAGFLNGILLLSLAGSMFCLVALFRHYRLPLWYSALIATVIAMLSPQILRFQGHYSLAHVLYFPLLLLLLHKLRFRKEVGYPVLLGVVLLWMSFTHMYYFLMAILFIGAYLGITAVGGFKENREFILKTGTVTILAAGVFMGFMNLTDPVTDRPQDVYGLTIYTATPAGTFLPFNNITHDLFTETLGIAQPEFESMSYTGIIPVVFLLGFFLCLGFRSRLRRHLFGSELTAWLLAGICVWIFATGILYTTGLDGLWDVLPQLRQFRSLGRLGWALYYPLAFAAGFGLYAFTRKSEKRIGTLASRVFLGIGILIWGFEAYQHAVPVAERLDNPNLYLSRSDSSYLHFFNETGIDPSTYQAQIMLPLTVVGPDKLMYDKGIWSMRESMRCALQTGLPMVNFNLSRTSISQSLSVLQLPGPGFLRKSRAFDMTDKPLLLLLEEDFASSPELELTRQGTYLGKVGSVSLFSLGIDQLKNYQEARMALASQCDGTMEAILIERFSHEGDPSHPSFADPGNLIVGSDATRILDLDTMDLERVVPLVLSFWGYLGPDTNLPYLTHQQHRTDGTIVSTTITSYRDFYPCDIVGNWLRFNYWFDPSHASNHRFFLHNEGAVVDNLMLRYADSRVCRIFGNPPDTLLMNNFWLQLNGQTEN